MISEPETIDLRKILGHHLVVCSVYIDVGNPKGVKRDFRALEKRRFQAKWLLDQGLNQSETARLLKVARQTVSAWRRQYRQQGFEALRRAGRAGRKPLLDAAQRERLWADRRRLAREFIELSEGHIVTEYMPPNAPQLNSMEYIWSY